MSKKQMQNEDFVHFIACNTPFVASDFEMCPLSQINDGQNDIVFMTFENGSTIKLARYLLDMEKGDIFNQDGSIRRT